MAKRKALSKTVVSEFNTFFEEEEGCTDFEYLEQEAQDNWDYFNTNIEASWKALFKKFPEADKMLVSGSMGLWNGRHSIDDTIIDSTEFEDFEERVSGNDNYKYQFFDTHMEVECYHHDGINYYTIVPFNWYDKTVKEIKEIIKNDNLEADFDEYLHKYELKKSKLKKDDYIEFIDYLSGLGYELTKI